MRRLIFIVSVLSVVFLFSACNSNSVILGEVFEEPVNDYEGVTMSIVDGTLSSTGATVCVLNTLDKWVDSGNEHDFGLQIEKNGKWYWLESGEEFANTAEAYMFLTDEPRELKMSWGNRYGKLELGRYRIVKRFFNYEEPNNRVDFALACEFTLD